MVLRWTSSSACGGAGVDVKPQVNWTRDLCAVWRPSASREPISASKCEFWEHDGLAACMHPGTLQQKGEGWTKGASVLPCCQEGRETKREMGKSTQMDQIKIVHLVPLWLSIPGPVKGSAASGLYTDRIELLGRTNPLGADGCNVWRRRGTNRAAEPSNLLFGLPTLCSLLTWALLTAAMLGAGTNTRGARVGSRTLGRASW